MFNRIKMMEWSQFQRWTSLWQPFSGHYSNPEVRSRSVGGEHTSHLVRYRISDANLNLQTVLIVEMFCADGLNMCVTHPCFTILIFVSYQNLLHWQNVNTLKDFGCFVFFCDEALCQSCELLCRKQVSNWRQQDSYWKLFAGIKHVNFSKEYT